MGVGCASATEALGWATQEFGGAPLGDPRRVRRAVQVLGALAAQPGASVPTACANWAATKGAYRFLSNPAVETAALRAAHATRTLARMTAEPVVLLVQDTTTVNFSRQEHTTGLGPIHTRRSTAQGLVVHSTLALTAEGVPLGVLDQQVWARDVAAAGQARTRKQRPTAQKESAKWLRGLTASTADLPPTQRALLVADREADVYDLLAAPRAPTVDLLVRAAYDRAVAAVLASTPARASRDGAAPVPAAPGADPVPADAPHLWAVVQALPVQGQQPVAVPRADGRPARTATVTLRWGRLQLRPPLAHTRRGERPPAVTVQVVLVQEVDPPPDVTPLEWLLLTTVPVTSQADAEQVVAWYRLRWRIEQFHYVLKQGCRFEQLQLDTADRLERALAVYSVVAWRVLHLTLAARATPDAPADTLLTSAEWQTLWCVQHRQPTPPAEPPPLRDAVRGIAALGGFLGRRGDGEPGVKALWLGWQRLQDLTLGFTLARQTSG